MSDVFERAQSQYKRKVERQKQVEMFEQVTSTASSPAPVVTPTNGESLGSSHSSRKYNSEHSRGAYESARRFLRDEDDDDILNDEEEALSDNKQPNRTGSGGLMDNKDWDSSSILRGDDAFANVDLHSTYGNRSYASGPYNPAPSGSSLHGSSSHPQDYTKNPNPIISGIAGCVLACWQGLGHAFETVSEFAIEMWLRFLEIPRKQKLVCAGIVTALIVVIVTVSVVASGGGGGGGGSSDNGSSNNNGGGGNVPTGSPPTGVPQHPLVPSDPERYEKIRKFILDAGITHVGELDETGSYQNRALHWLTENDVAHVRPDSLGLLQRYALATLFFSTYIATEEEIVGNSPGPHSSTAAAQTEETIQWTDTTNWMSSSGVCDWYGVHCVDNIYHFEESSDGNQNIVHLELSSNNIGGAIPSEVVALNRLATLDLSGNNLYGTIPASLGELDHLVNLLLNDNELTGGIPPELVECEHLRKLDLSNNELVGSIPKSFEALTALREYKLAENMLVGELPRVKNTTHLEILKIDDNEFTGSIPAYYGKLENMKLLNLRNNKLTGSIPDEVGFLKSIETFSLGFNQLTGTIPDTINGMALLTDFEIPHNQINGTIPDEIGELRRLEVLHLEANQMTGTLPDAIGELQDLRSFQFFRNDFTGSVPDALCNDNLPPRPKHLSGDCSEGGKITCSCCTKCYR